ncbi:MAG: LysM peptidoglycan-binding domain-containing protein [Spirochaetota bacterium]
MRLLLVLASMSAGIQAFSEPLPPNALQMAACIQNANRGGQILKDMSRTERKAHEPKQGHAGPAVYSLNLPMNDTLRKYINKYLEPENLEWLKKVLERGKPYLTYIESRIAYYQVPRELMYLPIVESAFYIHAISRSGAAGLWQFMQNSVSSYDLQINDWLDERRDFWKSTDASLEKLKYNYSRLGDWLLALAAYNCGLGKVTGIIEKTDIRDFWELAKRKYLPRETVDYVPKFLAIASICTYAGRNGLPLNWTPPMQWERIELDQAVDLGILSQESGVPLSILKSGNAELRYGVTPPASGTYFLKVPSQFSDVVKETLSSKRLKLMRFYIHVIQSGDTLYDLSRHFGVTVPMITKYNPGVHPDYLKIGAKLVIPSLKEVGPYRRNISSVVAGSASGTPFTGDYIVRKGDTLWHIAQRFQIRVEELALKNNISLNGILKENQVLKVPEVTASESRYFIY